MKLFGLEIRAVGKEPRNRESLAVGYPYVGTSSTLGGYLRYSSTDRNWRLEAGQLESNSTLAIGVNKIASKVAQVSLELKTLNPDGSKVYEPSYYLFPFTKPMAGLDESVLLKSITVSLKLYGNAYLLKRRSKTGYLLGLIPLMPWQVVPKSDSYIDGNPNRGGDLITRYQVTPYGGGSMFYVAPSEVVHFRDGLVDPNNPALGLSAVMACLRQVVTDNEASNYFATLMTNMGIPGVIFSPKDANAIPPTTEQRLSMRERWLSFTRDRRGQAMDLPGAFEITRVGMSPTDIQAIEQKVHGMTEILSALGVDPMVLGLPSDTKTYNNMKEAREGFIEDTILPLLYIISSTLERAFREEGLVLQDNQEFAFNISAYRELEEDITIKFDRAREIFKAGGSSRGEYRKAVGFQTDLDDPRTFFDLQSFTKPAVATRRYSAKERDRLEEIQLDN
jgi:HK97 family phage portal protein